MIIYVDTTEKYMGKKLSHALLASYIWKINISLNRVLCILYIYIYRVFVHLKKCGGKKCHTHCSLATCGKLNVRSKILISNIFGVLWFVKMCSLTLRLRWMVAHGRLAVRLSLSFIVSCRGWWWRMHEKLTCPNVHVF